jgi:hypothetical protein
MSFQSITSQPGWNIVKPTGCTPTHQWLSNSTKSVWRGTMVRKIKKTKKLPSFRDIYAQCRQLENQQDTTIYLWRKIVCFVLYCIVVMRSTEPGCFRRSWCLWKALDEKGYMAWFHDVWTCGAKVLEYWMISSLKINLNHCWKFRRNWNVALVLLERSWFVKIWIQNVGDIEFKVISATENSNKFQKTGFWKENQLRSW